MESNGKQIASQLKIYSEPSNPSPKAEPFKLWLAKVGYERIEETEYPELAFDRAM